MFVIKNNLVKKRQKGDGQQRLAPFLYLLHERTQVLVTFQHYHVSIIMSHRALSCTIVLETRPKV